MLDEYRRRFGDEALNVTPAMAALLMHDVMVWAHEAGCADDVRMLFAQYSR